MSYRDLSPYQLDLFWKYVRGDNSNEEFEKWLYDDSEIEAVLGSDDYLRSISVDYRKEQEVAEFKALLADALPSIADCFCHTKSDISFATLGDWSVNDFDVAKREVKGLPWLHQLVCKSCKTNWLVAEENLIYDVWLLFRGDHADVSSVMSYYGLLQAAAETGEFFGYVDPMNSFEIPKAIKNLMEEAPNLSIHELTAVLPISRQVVEHHLKGLKDERSE